MRLGGRDPVSGIHPERSGEHHLWLVSLDILGTSTSVDNSCNFVNSPYFSPNESYINPSFAYINPSLPYNEVTTTVHHA